MKKSFAFTVLLIAIFSLGFLAGIFGIHLAMTSIQDDRLEVWYKGNASVLFSLNRDFGPWYWKLTPSRNIFLANLRKELQKKGWERVQKDFDTHIKKPDKQCFLHLYRGGLPNFTVWKEEVLQGDFADGTYQGERHTSYNVEDIEPALAMCSN